MVQNVIALTNLLFDLQVSELSKLLRTRFKARPERVASFYDLADTLLSPVSLKLVLAELPDADIATLEDLAAGSKDFEAVALHSLREKGLYGLISGEPHALEEVSKELAKMRTTENLATAGHENLKLSFHESNHYGLAQKCSLILTKIISAGYVMKANGKLRGQDAAALVASLNMAPVETNELLDFLGESGVLSAVLKLSPQNQDLLLSSHTALFLFIARRFFEAAPNLLKPELFTTANLAHLSDNTISARPFLEPETAKKIKKYLAHSEAIGLSVDGVFSDFSRALLAQDLDLAITLLQKEMPPLTENIFVQPDFSVVAPSPLELINLLTLADIAEIKTLGLASSFQISKESLQNAKHRGYRAKTIKETLEKLSLNPLPQPLLFLLDELQDTKNALTLEETGAGCNIYATHRVLLEELLVDPRLKNLNLQKQNLTDQTFLATSVSSKYVQNMLHNAGYEVKTEEFEVNRPKTLAAGNDLNLIKDIEDSLNTGQSWHDSLAQTLSQQDPAKETDELARLIQIAKRSRTSLSFELKEKSGQGISFRALPVSLNASRLRVKDTGAEIERVVGLGGIKSVSLEGTVVWQETAKSSHLG